MSYLLKYFTITAVIAAFSVITVSEPLYGQERKRTRSKRAKSKEKKKQYIDLEGLDIQGLIDRPQTLYILKRSKIDFYDSIENYDYMKEIIDITYKEPF
jgi:hypothetical protein